LSLEPTVQRKIANQTFSLPPLELSRALSPKTPKPGVGTPEKLLSIDQYHCRVDGKAFDDALRDTVAQLKTFAPPAVGVEKPAYCLNLAEFLTNCVRACHDALDKQEEFPSRQDRWYKDLEFAVGRPATDGVGGTATLKPDVMGGNGMLTLKEEPVYWKPPMGNPAYQITLPVVVNKEWRGMVSQAAIHARFLFGASPMRVFALVLAFNHENNILRFLIFHHGGLTASEEHNITEADGLKAMARIFLTLALWRTAEEAGIITCFNDTAYLLPADQEGTRCVSAVVETMLFRSLSVRGRMTHVFRLRLPTSASLPVSQPLEKKPLKLFAESASYVDF
jgi:hypothetical protein